MSNNTLFDPNDPTLPANLPPDLQRIDAHLKHDGRYWQAHLPSEERLHQMARTMAFKATDNATKQHHSFPFRTFAGISSTAVVVGLLAALFVVLAYHRGNQAHPITKATATPPAPPTVYVVTDNTHDCCAVITALNPSSGQQRWKQMLKMPGISIGNGTTFWPTVMGSSFLADGKLFVFTQPGAYITPLPNGDNDMLYVLRASDGKLLWHVSLIHPIISPNDQNAPEIWATYANSIIYTGIWSISANPAYVDAYSANNGKLLWTHSIGTTCTNESMYQPLAADANAVYVSSSCSANTTTSQNSVLALRASDGSQLWSHPAYTGSVHNEQSALVNDVLYIVDFNGGITALRVSDGRQVWHVQEGLYTFDNNNVSSSLRALNGTIYVTYYHNSINHLFALRASDGKPLWSKQIPSLVDSLAATDRAVYYSGGTDLYALDRTDGVQLWHYHNSVLPHPEIFTPLAAIDSGVYISSASTLYALRPTDGSVMWQYQNTTDSGILAVG